MHFESKNRFRLYQFAKPSAVQYFWSTCKSSKLMTGGIFHGQKLLFADYQNKTATKQTTRCWTLIGKFVSVYLFWLLHRQSKNKTPNSCPYLHQILTDFQTSFTVRLSRKFVTKSYTYTPSHLKRVATLPCEISVFKKSSFLRSKWSKMLCKT